MAGAQEGATRFRRQLLGYDRGAVQAALASTHEQLRRAEARRDELIATTANVERIGAQVADMLRSLADRAVELEAEAAATAGRTVAEARLEADRIVAEADAVLAAAEARAEEILEASRQRQAAASSRRETAVVALRVAMEQLRRLTGTIEELAPEEQQPVTAATTDGALDRAARVSPETIVLGPWSSAPAAPPTADTPEADAPAGTGDPIAPVLARFEDWARSPS